VRPEPRPGFRGALTRRACPARELPAAAWARGLRQTHTLQNIMVNDVTPGQSVTVSYTSASGRQHTVTVILAGGPAA